MNHGNPPASISFEGRKWVIYGASGWPAYITPFAIVPSQRFPAIYGLSNEAIGLWKGKVFDWLFDEAELIETSKKILPSLLEKQWSYYDAWQVEAKRFDALHYSLMDAEFAASNDEDLIMLAKRYYEAFLVQYVANDFIEPVSFYFQNHLTGLLVDAGLDAKKAEELAGLYGAPAKPNYIKQCVQDYRALEDKNDVSAILKKYHYANNDYTGPKEFTEADLVALASKSDGHQTQIPSETLPPRAQALLKVLQLTATVQDVRKAESLMWISGAEKLLQEIAKRQGIPFDELLFASWDEVIDQRFERVELKDRATCCVIDWKERETNIYSGDRALAVTADFKKSIFGDTSDMKAFKGVSASRGKVQGRAAVVLNVSQFNKVKLGDILVTVMTRPEYLPVMELAAAFVTDEGGITCHAAILAREMKKPCVIGTKLGSKVIKDGDMLEVDADKGVVTIL